MNASDVREAVGEQEWNLGVSRQLRKQHVTGSGLENGARIFTGHCSSLDELVVSGRYV